MLLTTKHNVNFSRSLV